MSEVSEFADAVKNKGIGYIFGLIPRPGENKSDFKSRVVKYCKEQLFVDGSLMTDQITMQTIVEASEDQVWGS